MTGSSKDSAQTVSGAANRRDQQAKNIQCTALLFQEQEVDRDMSEKLMCTVRLTCNNGNLYILGINAIKCNHE